MRQLVIVNKVNEEKVWPIEVPEVKRSLRPQAVRSCAAKNGLQNLEDFREQPRGGMASGRREVSMRVCHGRIPNLRNVVINGRRGAHRPTDCRHFASAGSHYIPESGNTQGAC